ncbi:MAG: FG-GAP-like repeat-containing protein [Candidatus Poribacteria bacterium]|nr:FG-GAP-like repeat-containing protein [Candidatus Poribacteria bacterium]
MRTLIVLVLTLCLIQYTWSDIQFEDVAHQAGITRIGESWGNAWGDFDGDGYLDLWATNHKHKPSLYRNNKDGTFTDIIDEVWEANPYIDAQGREWLTDTHGSAWADFDNDGDQDLIVLSGGGGGTNSIDTRNHNRFFVNENGILIERALDYGLALPLLRGRTPLWFDWDNDGLLDVLFTGQTRPDRHGNLVTSSLFQQTPTGFQIVNSEAGFFIDKGSELAQLTDMTGDGNLDLFVDGNPYPAKIYDVSSTHFIDLTASLRVPKLVYDVRDSVFADFNGDLMPDAFLARAVYRPFIDTLQACTENHVESTQLDETGPCNITFQLRLNKGETGISFKTDGNVTFEIHSVWMTRQHHVKIGKLGLNLSQFNGEFYPNGPVRNVASFIFTLSPDDPKVIGLKPRVKNELWGVYIGYDPESERWNFIYHTDPPIDTNWTVFEGIVHSDNPIVDIEQTNFLYEGNNYNPPSVLMLSQQDGFQPGFRFAESINGESVVAGDFDNDMDVDLYIVCAQSSGNLPNRLYVNDGRGNITEQSGAGGAEGSDKGRGQSVTMADYDRDGYLDLFVTNGQGAYPLNNGPDQLFRNTTANGNNWLQIDLEGTHSNRDGIGARLYATTPDGKSQLRENSGGIHWCQQDQKRIHFGLAQNEKVSKLEIYWPSGILQTINDVDVNQVLHVVEEGIQIKIPGDVNRDRKVDILDLLVIIVHFGEVPPTNPNADVNKDGVVDIQDLVSVIEIIEGGSDAAAPQQQFLTSTTTNNLVAELSSLSDKQIALFHTFYEKIEDLSGSSTHINYVKMFFKDLLMPNNVPIITKLYANYPNPFNPETWIPYQLAEDSQVTIRIYNPAGQIVRTLFSEHQTKGFYIGRRNAAYWDGKNELGEAASSGLYFYELATSNKTYTKRLVILK